MLMSMVIGIDRARSLDQREIFISCDLRELPYECDDVP